MNKSIFFICFILLIRASGAFGQAMTGPYWLYDNNHLTDKYIINPAFAGNQYDPKIFISTQRMEVQLRDAPTIHLLGAHGRLDFERNSYRASKREARNAAGGLLFADNNGPFQTIGVKLDYAYFVPLNRKNTTLSFGLGGMLFSKRLRLEQYNPAMIDDPLIAANMGSKIMIPDVNAGVLLTHRQFYAGLSASQLLENSYQFSNPNYTSAQVYRNYYLMTGYRFVYQKFEWEPSVVAGYNMAPESYSNNGKFVDVSIEFFLKPVVFTLSYRVDGYVSSSLLYRGQKFEMGVRTELFSTNSSDASFIGVGLMASYTFSSK